jgi:Xaa-Pro aminopeptidase
MPCVPREDLDARLSRLRQRLDQRAPEWRAALVMSKVNLYYLTGTMPSGALLIPRDGEAVLWVRRSLTRSMEESAFPCLRPMRSFRDIAAAWPDRPASCLIEKEAVSLAHFERLTKYLPFERIEALDPHLAAVRAVKSPWELQRLEEAGCIHRQVLEDVVPTLLEAGMSEAELGADILRAMLRRGHHGVVRISMFDTEMFLGSVSFGESSIRPNPFDGPGGVEGLGPALPSFGSHRRHLQRGDLVFIDVGCGIDGYHTDKTMTYAFGDLPATAVVAHRRCVEIQDAAARLLRPGAIPEQIYEEVTRDLPKEFLENFMGYGDQQVRFLGHGVGLHIDEFPVIAAGFKEPLEANMTIALEPKKGIAGIGMVGIENTFVVTAAGGRCLTGVNPGLIAVP